MKTAGERKAGKKGKKINLLLIVIFLLGIGILLYPTFSNWWNLRTSSRAIATYDEAVAKMNETDYTDLLDAAREYNSELFEKGSSSVLGRTIPETDSYWELLDISGTGVMGYITIDKINVKIPVYHGTDDGVLQIAAGHLEGTSLPVGGENTHSVLSAHRGLPSAKLFTDLDELEEKDTFTITVLTEVVTYEVDQIRIVLPEEVEDLYMEEGQDYCTLMTCTPYGINSHRMLLFGKLIDGLFCKLFYGISDITKVVSAFSFQQVQQII